MAAKASMPLRKNKFSALSVAFMLYCMVASGAFGIEEMIPLSGPGTTILLLCIMPLIWAWPISSLVAECNAILPDEGGIYVWVREGFGEFWGFQAGWWAAISTYVCSGTYIALAAGYISQFVPLSGTAAFAVKIAIVLVFAVINLVGLKEVEAADTIFAIAILVAFGAVTVLGFTHMQTNPLLPLTPAGTSPAQGISEGIGIAIWMYCGYECIANMSGEFTNSRVISRGLKLVMPVIALSYILPTVAALGALPEGSWALWSTDSGMDGVTVGYASVISLFCGEGGRIAFLLVAIASQFAIYNTYLASGARSFFVLADDSLFFKRAAKTDKEGRSPYIGVLAIALSSILFSQFEFSTLVDIEIVFDLAIYVVLAIACVRLRKKIPLEQREPSLYRIGGGKAGLVFSTALPALIAIYALLVNGVGYIFYAVGALATGVVFYVVFKKAYGGLSIADPQGHPRDPHTGLAPGDTRRMLAFAGIGAALIAAELIGAFVLGVF